ncbi:tyrosine-type recombinase/integrase [Macellibacteroides fermentans]|uniref:tyrosine-type recombinase/integrase n=1 Tax=Macellibacteroides fermentans TaxID=879969 RepID=UPI00406CD259
MNKELKLLIRKDLVAKSGKARIEFLIYFDGKQYRMPTGKSIEPKFWIQDSELVDRKSDDAAKINSYLSKRKDEYDKYKKLKNALEEKMSLDDIKLILKGVAIEKAKETSSKIAYPTISKAFDDYIKLQKMKPGSQNNHRITKNVLVDFSITKYRKELTIEQIDYKFLLRFVKYLREERAIPNQQNTIAKRLKLLKTVLRFSIRVGKYDIENPFSDYTIEHGKHKEIALSKEEYLNFKRAKLPVSACKSLKLTKYIFTFCCETGLRFSDAMDLSWGHVDDKLSSLEKLQVKTNQPVFVPISNQARAILIVLRKHYKDTQNHVFPRIDIQVMNRYLKDLAKIAGIEKNLTSHVARHTFGTILGASGKMSAFMICEAMGHKDVGMSQRYINLSKDDLRNAMKMVWNQEV